MPATSSTRISRTTIRCPRISTNTAANCPRAAWPPSRRALRSILRMTSGSPDRPTLICPVSVDRFASRAEKKCRADFRACRPSRPGRGARRVGRASRVKGEARGGARAGARAGADLQVRPSAALMPMRVRRSDFRPPVVASARPRGPGQHDRRVRVDGASAVARAVRASQPGLRAVQRQDLRGPRERKAPRAARSASRGVALAGVDVEGVPGAARVVRADREDREDREDRDLRVGRRTVAARRRADF